MDIRDVMHFMTNRHTPKLQNDEGSHNETVKQERKDIGQENFKTANDAPAEITDLLIQIFGDKLREDHMTVWQYHHSI